MAAQSQALKWCIEHENPVLPKAEADGPVQFWQLKHGPKGAYYYNSESSLYLMSHGTLLN